MYVRLFVRRLAAVANIRRNRPRLVRHCSPSSAAMAPFSVSAHQPDAKMAERSLGNLLCVPDARSLNLDCVRCRDRHRITWHPGSHDRHPRRGVDDPAHRATFRNGEIDARVIACQRRSDQFQADRLGPFLTISDVDRDALVLGEAHNAATLQSRRMHEDVFAA